jgi:hypothetical protein
MKFVWFDAGQRLAIVVIVWFDAGQRLAIVVIVWFDAPYRYLSVDRKFHTPENQQSWANIIKLNRVATAVDIKVWSSIEDNFTY